MLDKWRLSLNKRVFAGGFLMDLSKDFDTINDNYYWQNFMFMD